MRLIIGLFIVLVWPLSVAADPVFFEPPDFPANAPGPGADHPATDCFPLAAGSIEPGDVDWVEVVIPFDSLQTVVDVDITSANGNSMLMAWIVGGAVTFNMNDMNGAADSLCGLGASTDLPGNLYDSVLDVGAAPEGTIINIGVTGYGDFGFTGAHTRSFDYEVWVFAFTEDTGCFDDAECDDEVACTSDTCDPSSGECINAPNDDYCDNGIFCDGVETCDSLNDCQPGESACLAGELCDEDFGCYSGVGPALDIKPGSCPNFVNRRSQGYLKMALLGRSDFDVTDVDMSTLVLSRADGQGGSVRLPGWMGEPIVILEDVSAPFDGEECTCAPRSPDGVIDAVIRFRTPRVVTELDLYDFDPRDVVELTVTAETYDGTSFAATDCVQLIDIRRATPFKRRR